MKRLLVIALLSSNASHADKLCGELDSILAGPKCQEGVACPHFVRLRYFITNSNGRTFLETSKSTVLTRLGNLKGDEVCAVGSLTKDELDGPVFDVTSIRPKVN